MARLVAFALLTLTLIVGASMYARRSTGSGGERSNAILYSPDASRVMYNAFVPCYHADPSLTEIPPGATRWTRSYLLLYGGDLQSALQNLVTIHFDASDSRE